MFCSSIFAPGSGRVGFRRYCGQKSRYSVLFLILSFVCAAGLFLLMGAEFLAMILVVVYVGAVAVLFLFVVMLLESVDFARLRQGFVEYLPQGLLIALVVAIELIYVVSGLGSSQRAAAPAPTEGMVSNTAALGEVLYTRYFYFFQGGGDDPADRDDRRNRSDPSSPSRASSARTSARRSLAPQKPQLRCARSPHAPASRRFTRMGIAIANYLTLAAIVFTIGIAGIILNHKNIIIILMSVELILLSVNINLVAFSTYSGDLTGQAFALFILTVAAAEAAIGLAILVAYYRNRGSIEIKDINSLKG